jgi:hypothetical protein
MLKARYRFICVVHAGNLVISKKKEKGRSELLVTGAPMEKKSE